MCHETTGRKRMFSKNVAAGTFSKTTSAGGIWCKELYEIEKFDSNKKLKTAVPSIDPFDVCWSSAKKSTNAKHDCFYRGSWPETYLVWCTEKEESDQSIGGRIQ